MLTATFEQVIKLVGWVKTGSGFTVTSNVLASPAQLFGVGLVGTTVIVTVCTTPLVLVNVKPLIFPVPLDALAVKPVGNKTGLVIAQA